MDFVYLRTFREVALRRSFTGAAAELGYAQSSVTTQIQKLEQSYGVPLFERFGSGLRPTSAGEELLGLATQMLELHQQAKERLARQGGGTLTIGTIDSIAAYFLPAILQQLRRQYPELTIRLQPGSEDTIVGQVKAGEIDIGLILDQAATDPALEWTTIREEPLVLLAAPDHPLARQSIVELQHLEGEEWIMTEASCNYRVMLEKLLRSERVTCRIGLELGNPEAVKRCVMAGAGIALLPEMAAKEEIRRGELAALPFRHADLRLELRWCKHPKKWMSRALQGYIALMEQQGE